MPSCVQRKIFLHSNAASREISRLRRVRLFNFAHDDGRHVRDASTPTSLKLLPLALALLTAAPAVGQRGPIPAASRQLVLVVTDGWAATAGTLTRFVRRGDAWVPEGGPVPVVVGRGGLGWGRGLHVANAARRGEPTKREGDGRAPAGAFALTEAFGYGPLDSARTGLPYVRATPDIECVDDGASRHYNRVLDRASVTPDWTSHEEMRRADSLYRRGVVVAHNAARVPGGGSCIFLHVWSGPGSTTSGCTAFGEAALASTMAWLDADARPVLVQLPAAVYRRLRAAWALPAVR